MNKENLAMINYDKSVEGSLNLLILKTQEDTTSTDSGFKNSLDRLTVDTLRMLCSAEGLPCSGSKKELVERFALRMSNKIKGKVSNFSEMLHPNNEHDIKVEERLKGESRKKDFGYSDKLDEIYYTGANKSFQESSNNTLSEKSLQATVLKALEEMKQSLYVVGSRDEDRFWPEELDEALLFKSIEPIVRAREIAYTRAYILQAVLRERLTLARQTAKNKRKRTDNVFLGNTYSGIQSQWGTYTQLPHPIQKPLLDQGNIYSYSTQHPRPNLAFQHQPLNLTTQHLHNNYLQAANNQPAFQGWSALPTM
ncbi:10486_t:CDS:2 [Dentiscutata heterogama]|uniref:10486_t:CDS:1 n=1 Tax=Dentiscutata heterogama TaxID=1316150 RepID=A0ACA9JVV1_9GLOM|nr:10486_t:CDS:2 [Dentiscutata heterogama]